ncbi:hypothetical protein ACJX0J_027607, partial [Zea mays]
PSASRSGFFGRFHLGLIPLSIFSQHYINLISTFNSIHARYTKLQHLAHIDMPQRKKNVATLASVNSKRSIAVCFMDDFGASLCFTIVSTKTV